MINTWHGVRSLGYGFKFQAWGFVVRYIMSILVLQSSWWRRESWLLCLICLPGVSWWLSGSSSRCHGVVCGLWLWYFLIILTYYFFTSKNGITKHVWYSTPIPMSATDCWYWMLGYYWMLSLGFNPKLGIHKYMWYFSPNVGIQCQAFDSIPNLVSNAMLIRLVFKAPFGIESQSFKFDGIHKYMWYSFAMFPYLANTGTFGGSCHSIQGTCTRVCCKCRKNTPFFKFSPFFDSCLHFLIHWICFASLPVKYIL